MALIATIVCFLLKLHVQCRWQNYLQIIATQGPMLIETPFQCITKAGKGSMTRPALALKASASSDISVKSQHKAVLNFKRDKGNASQQGA